VNEARLVGAKENGGVGHVADLAQPAKRRLLDDRADGGADVRCQPCGDDVVGQLHAHIGRDKPGIETVDPHTVPKLARFHRGDPPSCGQQPIWCRSNPAMAGNAIVAATDAILTMAPPAPAPPPGRMRAKRMFHAETGADDVDVAHPAQILSLEIDDERGNLDACVVDSRLS